MQGVAVFLEDLSVQAGANEELDKGRLTGDAIKLVREGISQGFLDWSPRIMLAMYSCEIQATSTFPLQLTSSIIPTSFIHPIRIFQKLIQSHK